MMIVFGGAFNPVTNAHLSVCDFLLYKHPDATFVFLPVSSAYTKTELASNHDRLEMLKLAIGDRENVMVSDLEINDSDYLGTYQSLIRLYDNYQEEIYFVIGADNLVNMHKWRNIHTLLSEFKIIVLGRFQLNIDQLISSNPILRHYPNQFECYPEFEINISSTVFRDTMDASLVPDVVYDYIFDQELYRGDDDVS